MHRRHFLTLSAVPLLLSALPARAAGGFLDYEPGLVDKRLAAGETVFVDFYATWCTTCRAQGRAIEALMGESPAYAQAITFVRVDWDQFAEEALTRRLNIPRRSTLVVLKADRELGRIVAGTAKAEIKALMDTALAAAGA
jgi:thiol:disulfide interchange protein